MKIHHLWQYRCENNSKTLVGFVRVHSTKISSVGSTTHSCLQSCRQRRYLSGAVCACRGTDLPWTKRRRRRGRHRDRRSSSRRRPHPHHRPNRSPRHKLSNSRCSSRRGLCITMVSMVSLDSAWTITGAYTQV